MKISVGNDHFGYPMVSDVIQVIKDLGHEVIHHGCYSEDPVDFPDIARKLTDSVRNGEADRGIMVCGTGVGASIAANKVPGIRATVAHDTHCAHQSVEHDNVNVITMGAQIIGAWLARDIIEAFLNAEFSTDEDFRRRVNKLREMELQAARELKDQI